MVHVGTAYTALFNYAFAKKNKGKFIVRIEDTDRKRHIKGAEKAIFDGLKWLGLSWDGKPVRQSDRLDLYNKKIDVLLKKGLAFKDEGGVRFKNPEKDVSWIDLVRGKITFPGKEVTDFVIRKSDGFPTYNFAVVVDDIDMKITHVIRGEEHISNTPRQLVLYEAFNTTPPKFAHNPTLRNKDHKKLSKRRDPVNLEIYKKQGYLPEALVNFLALLGWSHPGGKEIFSLDEFVKNFSIERVQKSGPIFNLEKLDWINGQYLKMLSDNDLSSKIFSFYKEYSKDMITKTTPLVKERIRKLSEYESLAGFFYESPKINKTLFGDNYKKHLDLTSKALLEIKSWNRKTLDKALLKVVDENEFHTGKFFMDLRIALTGSKVTPPINDSIIILGKEETISRIKKAL